MWAGLEMALGPALESTPGPMMRLGLGQQLRLGQRFQWIPVPLSVGGPGLGDGLLHVEPRSDLCLLVGVDVVLSGGFCFHLFFDFAFLEAFLRCC